MRSEDEIRKVVADLKWARLRFAGQASTVMLTAEITALNWALGEPDIEGEGSYEELRKQRRSIEGAKLN